MTTSVEHRVTGRQSCRAPAVSLELQLRFGVLVVGGELDAFAAARLRESLEPLIRSGGHVRVNVRDVTFIGSAGLHVLDDAAQALGARGRLVLLDPSNVVLRAVELIGLDDAVDILTPKRNRHVA